jgi:hypothetical protein
MSDEVRKTLIQRLVSLIRNHMFKTLLCTLTFFYYSESRILPLSEMSNVLSFPLGMLNIFTFFYTWFLIYKINEHYKLGEKFSVGYTLICMLYLVYMHYPIFYSGQVPGMR